MAPNLMVRIILLWQLVCHAKNGSVPFGTRTGFLPESSPSINLNKNLSVIQSVSPMDDNGKLESGKKSMYKIFIEINWFQIYLSGLFWFIVFWWVVELMDIAEETMNAS